MYQGSIVHVLAMLLRNATFSLQDITDELQRAIGDNTTFGTIITAGGEILYSMRCACEEFQLILKNIALPMEHRYESTRYIKFDFRF